jgi:hypothetical protein
MRRIQSRYLEQVIICWPVLELFGCLRSGFKFGGRHDDGPVCWEGGSVNKMKDVTEFSVEFKRRRELF